MHLSNGTIQINFFKVRFLFFYIERQWVLRIRIGDILASWAKGKKNENYKIVTH